jgi:hypothetical protein
LRSTWASWACRRPVSLPSWRHLEMCPASRAQYPMTVSGPRMASWYRCRRGRLWSPGQGPNGTIWPALDPGRRPSYP